MSEDYGGSRVILAVFCSCFSSVGRRKENLCSSAPSTIYQLGIKEIINSNSYKINICCLCVQVHPFGAFLFCFVLFFNQSCCLVHSKVTFCFSDFLFNVLFHVVLHFWGSKLTLKKKVNGKRCCKMGKIHHTETKRQKFINFLAVLFFK